MYSSDAIHLAPSEFKRALLKKASQNEAIQKFRTVIKR